MRGGREEGEGGGGSFAGEREIGHEDSIRSGGDPASGRRSWTGFKVNSKVLVSPSPETKLLRVTTRHRALVRPTDEETSDERRGTVGNREMGRTDPWNGSWEKCFRSSTLGIGPTSCPIRTPPPPRPREIREVYEGFVTSSNWIVAMDTCILEMEI